MGILNIQVSQAGIVGTLPTPIYINTNDTYATVTATGYLNEAHQLGTAFSNEQMALVYTSDEGPVWLKVVISGANYSLVQISSPGDVTLPTIADHLIVSSDTVGTLANKTGSVINSGGIQAGLDATAGVFTSFPGTTASGTLKLAAVDSSADVAVTISNADHGQASVYSIPDGGAATANIAVAPAALVDGNVVTANGTDGLLQDGGFSVLANTTGTYGGGGTSNAFTATGVGATSIVTASILASTNAVSIVKVVPSADTLTIDFSADPGAATTVNWIAITPAV